MHFQSLVEFSLFLVYIRQVKLWWRDIRMHRVCTMHLSTNLKALFVQSCLFHYSFLVLSTHMQGHGVIRQCPDGSCQIDILFASFPGILYAFSTPNLVFFASGTHSPSYTMKAQNQNDSMLYRTLFDISQGSGHTIQLLGRSFLDLVHDPKVIQWMCNVLVRIFMTREAQYQKLFANTSEEK